MDWNSMVLFLTTFDLYTEQMKLWSLYLIHQRSPKVLLPSNILVDAVELLLSGRCSFLHLKIFINSGSQSESD
jgi:hypothetical protein